MELMEASRQWAQRPADERYWSLAEMYREAAEQREISQSVKVPLRTPLRVGYDALEEDMMLAVENLDDFTLNNWTFGQLCSRVSAPADYLIGLDDPELVASCLNRGLRNAQEGNTSGTQLYHEDNQLRAITSNRYTRIHDCDILERLLPLNGSGWKTPPAWAPAGDVGSRPATAEDVVNFSLVEEGDMISPSGLYRGDRDMFVFLVNDENRIDDGTDQGLGRGFFVRNSEVGYASFSYIEFAYRYVCGNHIVWGAQDVREVKLRHVGADTPEKAFSALTCELVEYANASTAEDELVIERAKKFVLGKDKEEVLNFLFGKRLMSRKLATDSYDICEKFEPQLNPRSAWGIVQGLTRGSQSADFADKRDALDSITPKILQYAV